MEYDKECYLSKKKKRVRFKPEIKIKEFNKNKKLFFPDQEGLDKTKLKLTNIGVYSIVQKSTTDKILEVIKKRFKKTNNLILTDANGGMGGIAIHLHSYFKTIKIVEVVKSHQKVIEQNLEGYQIKNYKLYKNNYLDIMNKLKQDIIFFDPPWGGVDYKKFSSLKLGLDNIDMSCIIKKLLENNKAKMIILRIPSNFDIYNFKKLVVFKFKIVELYKKKKLIVFNN